MPAGGPEDFASGNLHDNTVSSTPYTVSIRHIKCNPTRMNFIHQLEINTKYSLKS